MQRIDSDGSVLVLPTPEAEGTPGYFGRGNPALGVRATKVSADFLNAVQEEIVGVIEEAGLTPTKGTNDQLLAAIETLVERGLGTALASGLTLNLGVKLAAGVFSVCAADGSDLSASNPGYVILQDKDNPGRLKAYTVTANQSFNDDAHASSEIIGNRFGVTTGIAWGSDCPFFIYAVGNDAQNAVAFMLSRDPRATVAPAEAAIGAPDDTVANTEGSFFSFENITESNFDGNPCACLGAIRMRMSTSDDWTVQSLTTKDGIGRFHESTKFTFPTNQNGAASASHIKANGGTAPVFGTQSYVYWVRRDGSVRISVEYNTDGGTDGSGAVTTVMTTPLNVNVSEQVVLGMAVSIVAGTADIDSVHFNSGNGGLQFVARASTTARLHSAFTNADRALRFALEYQAFGD